MKCQVDQKQHVWHLLLFALNQGQTASKAANDVCAVYVDSFITTRTAQKWFVCFRNKNFELEDSSHFRQPLQVNIENLKTQIEDSCQTTRELGEKLGCTYVSVAGHLHSIGNI